MKSHVTSAQHSYVKAEKPWSSVLVQTFFRGNLLKYFSGPVRPGDVELRLELAEEGDSDFRKLIGMSCGWEPGTKTFQFLTPVLPGREIHSESIATCLLRHYRTSTYAAISTGFSNQVFWQQTVIQLACEHDFLLLAILSLTSLHLAHINPEHHAKLTMQASLYQDMAMSKFREAIANPTPKNCNATLVFHHLLVMYTFAAEPKDDDLLWITREGDEVVPRWLHFIRSACDLLCDVWEWVEKGPCQALAFSWEAPFETSKVYEESTLELLLTLIPPASSKRAWTGDVINIYQEAASELALAFACSESSPSRFTIWDVLRIWPVKLSTMFMTLLQEEQPCALILFAHYTVLLERIDNLWYFQGRANSLLKLIHRKLDPYWHTFIPPVLKIVMA